MKLKGILFVFVLSTLLGVTASAQNLIIPPPTPSPSIIPTPCCSLTPIPIPTPTPPILDAHLYFNNLNGPTKFAEPFNLGLNISLLDDRLASYGFTLTYDSSFLAANNVKAGQGGFLSAANLEDPGVITVAGFDITGKGPGKLTDFLIFNFTPINPMGGYATLTLKVDIFTNENYTPIDLFSNSIGYGLYTHPANTPGDVNDDGTVSIVDALIIAQKTVGLPVPPFNNDAADVDLNGTITITDALIIAQYLVGIIPELPYPMPTPTPYSTPYPYPS